ncbi:MAG: hypothetical protein Q8R92_01510 [Deltaproteobacteria bacterium]|nr:hypothetical protein [Deltaproteobacteria bacterium]
MSSIPPRPDLIREENARPGTEEWILRKTRIDPGARFRSSSIEGFCSRQSVRPGESISFHVSTNPPSPFTLDLYRMGYYGGAGGRHMLRLGPFTGEVQPDPPVGPMRLRECRWNACAGIEIPADWPSGVYLGKLTAGPSGDQSYVIFVVRDDRPADFIFQCSDLTWQAYNRWPDSYALYDDGKKFWYWGPDTAVSFDRPYGKYCQLVDAPLSTGSGEWLLWEFPVAYWLESRGHDVTYISGIDAHQDPGGLLRARGFLSVGHDEYYTRAMYDHLLGAIAAGLNVAFLSGNVCCGEIGLRPGGGGAPDRVFSRTDRFGGASREETAVFPEMAQLPASAPDEKWLVGARTPAPPTGSADWICTAPDHWLFEGTGMRNGDGIAGLVGWEYHGEPADIRGLEVVASGETQSKHGDGVYTATVYPGAKGNIVFNAATCWWGDGLAEPPGYVRPQHIVSPKGPDPRLQRITENLLARMRGGSQ